ncbi:YciI family protein [Winogradskyella sp. A3E31]|uniref:YciI family protein n=1 Tax=Winogradskyella sp. A3E31 TaxID=3349637 RepID=UPI00398B417F
MGKTLTTLILLLSIVSMGYSQEEKQLFAMVYSKGKAWNENVSTSEQLKFKQHSIHLQNLRKEKKIIIGGRYSDYGFMILEAKNIDEAKLITQRDSTVINGVFKVELFEFLPFFEGCIGEEKQ